MAVTTGTMLAISAGVSAAGALAQGVAAKRAGDAQAARDEMAARQQQDAAGAEADRIRRAGERAKGAARAQLAASGIQGWKGVSARQADPLGDFIQRGNRGSGD